MIFVAAGTRDGREIVKMLLERGFAVAASAASAYGGRLLTDSCAEWFAHGKLHVNDEPLPRDAMLAYWREHDVTVVVDASHPYAVHVSKTMMSLAAETEIPYIRYERDLTQLPVSGLQVAADYDGAAEMAASCGKTVFLTTGSHSLRQFTEHPALRDHRIVARVLPTVDVISLCAELRLQPKDIIAMQGPFSRELNRAMFAQYAADVIVTKNSGTVGGTDTKLLAAQDLGLPVVMIDRPKLAYPHLAQSVDAVLSFVEEHDGIHQKTDGD